MALSVTGGEALSATCGGPGSGGRTGVGGAGSRGCVSPTFVCALHLSSLVPLSLSQPPSLASPACLSKGAEASVAAPAWVGLSPVPPQNDLHALVSVPQELQPLPLSTTPRLSYPQSLPVVWSPAEPSRLRSRCQIAL